jgi:hypothetical protein
MRATRGIAVVLFALAIAAGGLWGGGATLA